MAEYTNPKSFPGMHGFVAVILATLMLTACGTLSERVDQDDETPSAERSPEAQADREDDDQIVLREDDSEEGGSDSDSDSDSEDFDETEQYIGSGVFIDDSAARPRSERPDDDGEITLNFEGQGIQEVVQAILGHMFQENYVIAPGVSGEVTFSTARPLKRDQVMPVLEMLLRWNNATLIWREGRYHVVPISDAVRGNLVPRADAAERGRGYEVMVVPLEFISPEKMVEILEPYAREDGIFNADNARNLLFLAGTQHELRNYQQIIDTFDVDWLAGMSVGIFNLQRIEVDELLPELEGVFGEGGDTPLAGMFRFVPLERLNAVMVITPNEHYLEEAEKWIDRLDRSSPEAGARLYVYRVKNLEADVLAGYLGDLFGDGGSRQRRPREDRGGLAPGLEPATTSTVGEFQRDRSENQSDNQDQSRATEGGMQLGEEGDVRITAVQETNSLLIQSSPSQYDAILNAIERLDEEPLQVMIEAQIIEVTLNDQLRYGVNWFISNAQPGSDDFELPEDSGFARSRAEDRARLGGGGFFSSITRRSLDRTFVAATLDMLETVSDVRTLSTPSLLVRNNSEANINVGRQVPVQSTSFTGSSDRVIGSFQYINTGVILSVTPRVNPGGLVYLQVDQEVSSPSDIGGGDDGRNPTVDTRRVSTDVAVQSGQTVMLGGLIQETNSTGRDGVPGLSRIPGLGRLFGSRNESSTRSETLVLITPTVLESTSRLEEVSRDIEKQFKGLEPFNN